MVEMRLHNSNLASFIWVEDWFHKTFKKLKGYFVALRVKGMRLHNLYLPDFWT